MNKSIKLLVTLIIALSFKTFAVVDSIGMRTVEGKPFIIYMVTAGETIYGISTKYQVSIDKLMIVNPELENGLRTGQIINIPYRKEAIEEQEKTVAKETNYHTVQPGETLFSLSKKYKIPLNDLMKWNGMELESGQKIVVSKPMNTEKTSNEKIEEYTEKQNTYKGQAKPDFEKEEKKEVEVKEEEKIVVSNLPKPVLGPKTRDRVLIIPFDPYLYFSDADDEIAHGSRLHRTEVRQVFRKRLDALVDPPGFETIHLLGGMFKDSLGDLNRIYKSVTYNYSDILENGRVMDEQFNKENKKHLTFREKTASLRDPVAASKTMFGNKEEERYFGVKVKNENLFDYFNAKYDIDYYVFINQFEIKTNYEHCLDRASQNYERSLVAHYSIFYNDGTQLAGNRLKVNYESNSNNVKKIVADNVPKIARQIMNHLPPPGTAGE